MVLALEDRIAPATVNWMNPAGGDWDTPGNWSTGALPGSSDDVVINMPGITVTHQHNNSDSINSLTSSDPLNLSGGSLAIAGNAAFSANLNLSGGNEIHAIADLAAADNSGAFGYFE